MLERAFSIEHTGVVYRLGAGKILDPRVPVRRGDPMDCSEFVCWSLGIKKLNSDPLYVRLNGGWVNTTALVYDATHTGGLFTRTSTPQAGDVIVYGWRNGAAGHVGLITRVENGTIVEVIHCSSGRYRKTGNAIGRDGARLWTAKGAIVARPDWL